MRRTTIRVPAKAYVPEPFWLRMLRILGIFAGLTAVYIVVLAILFDYFTGCQRKIYHEDGTYETQSCMFIPYTPVKGTWK